MHGFIEAMARGSEGRQLTNFVSMNGLSLSLQDDWCEDKIHAVISGRKLSNVRGNLIMPDGLAINDEWLVHLQGRRARCTLNLSVLLTMAAAYCVERQRLANEVVQKVNDQVDRAKQEEAMRVRLKASRRRKLKLKKTKNNKKVKAKL